jgi:hypothetical protein
MTQWVKVEFYGLVPDGQRVEEVDLLTVGGKLGEAFGFSHIDCLSVVDASSHEAPA